MWKNITELGINHPRLVVLAALLLFVVSTFGARYLSLDFAARSNFAKNNEHRLAFENFEANYGRIDDLILVVESEDGILQPDRLALLEEMTTELWQTPYSTRVDSLTNYQFSRGTEDTLIVEPLVMHAESLSPGEVAAIQAIALADDGLVDRLVSRDGRVAGFHVLFHFPEEQQRDPLEVEAVAYVKNLIARVEADHPDVQVYLTGIVGFNRAAADVATSDMKTLVPGMYALSIVLLLALLRSVVAVTGLVIVSVMTTLSALGIAGWLDITLYMFSLSSVTVIIALTMAHCVHVLINFLQSYGERAAKRDALRDSMRLNAVPIFLTSATTLIGFLSMNLSELPPTRALGNIVALGISFAFIYSLTFLPAFIAIFPVRPQPRLTAFDSCMDALANFVVRWRGPILGGCLLVSVFFLCLMPRNVINDQLYALIDESQEFRQDTDFIGAHLGGLYTLEMSIDSGEAGGIADPDYLRYLDSFVAWLREQPEVTHVMSYVDVMKRLNRNMHGEDAAYYVVPQSRVLAAQYLLLYEMSLPFGLDLGKQVNSDRSASRLLVAFGHTGSQGVLAFQGRVYGWQEANLPPRMRDIGTGMVPMFTHIGQTAMYGSIYGALLALTLISVLLVGAMCSLRYGLISIVPNLLPAAIGFGIWAVFKGSMGMTISGVLGITIGVIVDDTVHLLSKYLRGRRHLGMGPEAAVRYSLRSAGPAVLITSVVLVSGFCVLATSDYLYNSEAGLLTAIIIACALVLDLLMLPALLLLTDRTVTDDAVPVLAHGYAESRANLPVVQ